MSKPMRNAGRGGQNPKWFWENSVYIFEHLRIRQTKKKKKTRTQRRLWIIHLTRLGMQINKQGRIYDRKKILNDRCILLTK